MNMLLHGVKDSEFEIFHGDSLMNDWEMLRETNPAKKPHFDAVVANPPFSYRWNPLKPLARMCASRITEWHPNPPLILPFYCTVSIT